MTGTSAIGVSRAFFKNLYAPSVLDADHQRSRVMISPDNLFKLLIPVGAKISADFSDLAVYFSFMKRRVLSRHLILSSFFEPDIKKINIVIL